MNTVAILPQLLMKLLQTQNVKINNVKQVIEKEKEAIVMQPLLVKEDLVTEHVTAVKKEEIFIATDSSTTIGTTLLDDLQQTTVL